MQTFPFYFHLILQLGDLMVSYKTSPTEETIIYRRSEARGTAWQQAVLYTGRIRNQHMVIGSISLLNFKLQIQNVFP